MQAANYEVLFARLGYSALRPRTLLLHWSQGLLAPEKTTLAGVQVNISANAFLWNLRKWDSGICELGHKKPCSFCPVLSGSLDRLWKESHPEIAKWMRPLVGPLVKPSSLLVIPTKASDLRVKPP